MFRYMYIVFGAVVVIVTTVTNLNYSIAATSTGSGWVSHSSGMYWGGSSGSTGGFSSGAGHK
jgi:hypothetical protein